VLRVVEQLQPALQQKDRVRQNGIVRQLVEMHAPMGDQWQALANLVLGNGECTLARQAMDMFVEEQGGAPQAKYLKAAILEQSGAMRDAYDLMCTLPRDVPDPAANAYSRGTAALYLGAMEEGRRDLERATRLQPRSGPAWWLLAMSADLGQATEVADRILAAGPEMENAPPAHRAPYLYAAGKVHAERGEHGSAFAAIARGARDMQSLRRYDREADRRNALASVQDYDIGRIREIAERQSEATGRAIFVTGPARSGTTLVEQILTSHSTVGSGGEINRLPLLAREMDGYSYQALVNYVRVKGVAEVAHLWDHLLTERMPAPGRVVDKSLSTTRMIGLAAALLPEAPLIWLTRDPLDRAWSSFRTFFADGLEWSYDLEAIAFFSRLEDALLQRWRDILGDRLLVVPYERLVTEPEAWIRRILAHCGLAEEPQVFAPHEAERLVTTASVMQVRRPINRDGIGPAEPYREFLQPFITAYGAY